MATRAPESPGSREDTPAHGAPEASTSRQAPTSKSAGPPSDVTPLPRAPAPDEAESELRRLVRFLTTGPRRFALAVASSNHAGELLRRRRQAETLASAAGKKVATVTVTATSPVLAQLQRAAAEHDALFVVGLDKLLLDSLDGPVSSPLVEQLNWDRDHLVHAVPTRVVLWLRRAAVRQLALAARDLDDVVMTRCSFDVGVAPAPVNLMELGGALMTQGPGPERAVLSQTPSSPEELRLLDQRLSTADSESLEWANAARLRAHLAPQGEAEHALTLLGRASAIYARAGDELRQLQTELDAAMLRFLLGRYHEVAEHLRTLIIPMAKRMSHTRLQAANWLLAATHVALGRADDALQVLQTLRPEDLEVIGAGNSAGAAAQRVADLLLAQQRKDDALAGYRVAARLFLAVSDFVAYQKVQMPIAALLTEQGHIDESLALLREEALPTLRQAFTADTTAALYSTLVLLLNVRGELDEALGELHRHVQPALDKLAHKPTTPELAGAYLATYALLARRLRARDEPGDQRQADDLLGSARDLGRRLGLGEQALDQALAMAEPPDAPVGAAGAPLDDGAGENSTAAPVADAQSSTTPRRTDG